jgi:hypothetical protein
MTLRRTSNTSASLRVTLQVKTTSLFPMSILAAPTSGAGVIRVRYVQATVVVSSTFILRSRLHNSKSLHMWRSQTIHTQKVLRWTLACTDSSISPPRYIVTSSRMYARAENHQYLQVPSWAQAAKAMAMRAKRCAECSVDQRGFCEHYTRHTASLSLLLSIYRLLAQVFVSTSLSCRQNSYSPSTSHYCCQQFFGSIYMYPQGIWPC